MHNDDSQPAPIVDSCFDFIGYYIEHVTKLDEEHVLVRMRRQNNEHRIKVVISSLYYLPIQCTHYERFSR